MRAGLLKRELLNVIPFRQVPAHRGADHVAILSDFQDFAGGNTSGEQQNNNNVSHSSLLVEKSFSPPAVALCLRRNAPSPVDRSQRAFAADHRGIFF